MPGTTTTRSVTGRAARSSPHLTGPANAPVRLYGSSRRLLAAEPSGTRGDGKRTGKHGSDKRTQSIPGVQGQPAHTANLLVACPTPSPAVAPLAVGGPLRLRRCLGEGEDGCRAGRVTPPTAQQRDCSTPNATLCRHPRRGTLSLFEAPTLRRLKLPQHRLFRRANSSQLT
jgi:hypothetical protein